MPGVLFFDIRILGKKNYNFQIVDKLSLCGPSGESRKSPPRRNFSNIKMKKATKST